MSIGFIGLGIMGAPMRGPPIGAGPALFVHTRSQVPAALAKRGATMCASAHGVAQQADTAIILLPDIPDVQKVLFSEHGVASGLNAGKAAVGMNSILPIETKAFAQRIDALDLDAPVSSCRVGARAGAPDTAFARVLPLFERMGKSITHADANGDGQTCAACGLAGKGYPALVRVWALESMADHTLAAA